MLYLSHVGQPTPQAPLTGTPSHLLPQNMQPTVSGPRMLTNSSLSVVAPAGGAPQAVGGFGFPQGFQGFPQPQPQPQMGPPVVGSYPVTGGRGGMAVMVPAGFTHADPPPGGWGAPAYSISLDEYGNIISALPNYVQVQNSPYRFGQ